jgi:hypothetical protein
MSAGCKRKGRNGLGSPRRRKPDRERIAREENAGSDRQTLLANEWMPAQRVLLFGKHKGKTLGQIGESDDGLSYLLWVAYDARDIDLTIRRDVLAYLDFPIVQDRLRPLSRAPSPDIHSAGQADQPVKEPVPEPRVQASIPPFVPGSFPYRLVG